MTLDLSDMELKAIMRQFTHFDVEVDGQLSFAEFAALCGRIAGAHHLEVPPLAI